MVWAILRSCAKWSCQDEGDEIVARLAALSSAHESPARLSSGDQPAVGAVGCFQVQRPAVVPTKTVLSQFFEWDGTRNGAQERQQAPQAGFRAVIMEEVTLRGAQWNCRHPTGREATHGLIDEAWRWTRRSRASSALNPNCCSAPEPSCGAGFVNAIRPSRRRGANGGRYSTVGLWKNPGASHEPREGTCPPATVQPVLRHPDPRGENGDFPEI